MADSEAKWYILHTYSGYENKVAADITKLVENRNLQHLIEQAIVPTVQRTVEKENGVTDVVEDKVYP
ncbi:MAG: transcription termination/antitermination protein NusG, partial [Oscillospiraceae bacterium]|nr:transcription termination/antitermination protein NusG [Oscillospiraceae bacterium]